MSTRRAPENPHFQDAPISSDTRASGRWKAYSGLHDWVARALAYDRRLAQVEHQSRELAIVQNTINWVEERQLDMLERLETYRNLRTALKLRTRQSTVPTITRITSKNEQGQTVTTEVRLIDQFKILNDLRESLFPPDEMDLQEDAPKWSKFAPRDALSTITSLSESETVTPILSREEALVRDCGETHANLNSPDHTYATTDFPLLANKRRINHLRVNS